jgi:glycolate oxidase
MAINPDCLKKLEHIVGRPHFSVHREDLVCYGYDATAAVHVPDAVVFPVSAQQVSQIMKLAAAFRTPVIPRGGGSGMTGGALAVNGGIVIVFSRMNRIVEVDQDNLIARVQPGVITARFQRHVQRHGLVLPAGSFKRRIFHHGWQSGRMCRWTQGGKIRCHPGLCAGA